MNEHADPEASEPTAPNLEARERGARGRGVGRPAGAIRSAVSSRGAGWGVAAALAGLLAGIAIGHSTAPSSSSGPVLRSVSIGPVQRQAVAPGAPSGVQVFGRPVAGLGQRRVLVPGLGLGSGCRIVAPPGMQVPFAGAGAVHVQIVRPRARASINYYQVVWPRTIFLGPAGQRTIILGPTGPAGLVAPFAPRTIILGPAAIAGQVVAPRAIVQRVHGGPGGLTITCVGAAQP